MKIAVVVSTYPPYKGGMGNVAQSQVEVLRRADHEVTVFTPKWGTEPLEGVIQLKPLFRWGNSASVPQLIWRLRGFDVVELHYPFFGGAEWVWWWKKLFGRRARLVVLYHMDAVGSGLNGLIYRLYNFLYLGVILRAADRILVTSRDYAASSLMARFAQGPKVVEVPLAVDTVRFSPAPKPPAMPTALFVGGLDQAHYFKGVENLIRAFAAAVWKHPVARLAIVGAGDLRPTYEKQARELGVSGRVSFLGNVPDGKLPDAYRQASFHVLPSVDRSEAFGLVTLEAAASGIPSIVSDLPGVRTVVVPEVTGLLVPPGDVLALELALDRFFTDSALTEAMGAAARSRAEERYAREVVERIFVAAMIE
jgi:glycosyltransferase involved in cell wall biosynthesis